MLKFSAESSSLLMQYNPHRCCVHATLLAIEKGRDDRSTGIQ